MNRLLIFALPAGRSRLFAVALLYSLEDDYTFFFSHISHQITQSLQKIATSERGLCTISHIHYNFLPPNNFENGSRLYEGQASCNQMQIMLSVSTKESPISSDDQRLILGFQHARAEYRETINIKKFGNMKEFQFSTY